MEIGIKETNWTDQKYNSNLLKRATFGQLDDTFLRMTSSIAPIALEKKTPENHPTGLELQRISNRHFSGLLLTRFHPLDTIGRRPPGEIFNQSC